MSPAYAPHPHPVPLLTLHDAAPLRLRRQRLHDLERDRLPQLVVGGEAFGGHDGVRQLARVERVAFRQSGLAQRHDLPAPEQAVDVLTGLHGLRIGRSLE